LETKRRERAALVTVILEGGQDHWPAHELSKELYQLSQSTGVFVVGEMILRREKPTASLFIGTGKTEEIHNFIHEKQIDVVIFNNDLSNAQQKNLEEILGVKVIDRTQLILDIFAQRARSMEGKIQVELAQLEYLLPRLTGKGIMLSRLGGGIGTRGPGEQKLEVDRRRIAKRIVKLKKDLEELKKRRHTISLNRKDKALPLLALIGYTNAGKTTLINVLCGEHQKADDRPFTTLDTIVRKLVLPNNQSVLISDTVGFIHNLPHHLIEAFKATLEEVISADLLIHVVDVSTEMAQKKEEAVFEVLKQLGVEKKPTLVVLNKIDNLKNFNLIEKKAYAECVAISAKKKINIDKLSERIILKLSNELQSIRVVIPHNSLSLLNIIHKNGHIQKEEFRTDGVYVEACLPIISAKKILTKLNCML
jgi:GTP-binding protein HflX